MNGKVVYDEMIHELSDIFGLREAEQMTKIYFEDIFGIKLGARSLELNQEQLDKYATDLIRLKGNEPIAYVTGRTVFYGYPYSVNNNVLIPRPETEELVHWIHQDTQEKQGLKVLDIGTGSGCIAISLAKLRSDFVVDATDVSSDALKVAEMNAKLNNVKVDFILDDILSLESKVVFEEYDVIVSNPPYISQSEMGKMSKSTIVFEPDLALYGQEDGLIFYRIFSEKLKAIKGKGVSLYIELNEFKADQISELFDSNKFHVRLQQDMQGKKRMMRVDHS